MDGSWYMLNGVGVWRMIRGKQFTEFGNMNFQIRHTKRVF